MHTDHQIRHAILLKHLPERHGNLSFVRELYCIGKEIDNNLTDTQFVSHYVINRHIFVIYFIMNTPHCKTFRKHIIELISEFMQAECLLFQFYLISLDTRHVQNVIDQCQQMIRLFFRLGQIFVHTGVLSHLIPGQCQHTPDTIHRSTDLMGHPIQERSLSFACFFCLMQLFLVTCNLLMQLRRLMHHNHIVNSVRHPLNTHLNPTSVRQLNLITLFAFAAPALIFFPRMLSSTLILKANCQTGHIILNAFHRHAKHLLHIAHHVHRKLILRTHQDTDFILPLCIFPKEYAFHISDFRRTFSFIFSVRQCAQKHDCHNNLHTANHDH